VISRCKLSDEQCKLFGGLNECSDVEVILQMILRPILDLGHGGAVVVIPNQSESSFSNALESPNGVMNLSLFERAAEHPGACIACHNQDDLTDAFSSQSINRSLQTRGRLAIASGTIGELASVDGCVVLNRDLSVVSFGAKINTTREQAERSEIQFRNARTEAVLDLAALEKEGGTRLRTALWLCKTFPNVIVFVVSQDQNLKVLWSENTTAFAFGPIALRTIPEFV